MRVEVGKDRIYSFDGRIEKSTGYEEGVSYFHDLNKTETEYAKHLIALREASGKEQMAKGITPEEAKAAPQKTPLRSSPLLSDTPWYEASDKEREAIDRS